MKEEIIDYEIDGKKYRGFWAFPSIEAETPAKRPAVLVAHAWMGQDDFAREKARMLASLGYFGFAVDMYGEGKTASNPEEAEALMLPLFEDRALLRKRILGAFEVVSHLPGVDQGRIGGIGFCFGGLTIIELLRSGAPVKGCVSFHGVLGNTMGPIHAKTTPIAKGIEGSLLILHGYNDPLVSLQDIVNTQKELSEAMVDWQMHFYSQTSHAFTNPQANDVKNGLVFQSRSCDRALRLMKDFFKERL